MAQNQTLYKVTVKYNFLAGNNICVKEGFRRHCDYIPAKDVAFPKVQNTSIGVLLKM